MQTLTTDQLNAIYTGEITDWSEIEGATAEGEIAVGQREDGSGTRDAFEELVPAAGGTPPVQELGSNAAVRIAVAYSAGPAVLSMLAVRSGLESGQLLRVPLAGSRLRRPLTAVWNGPRRLSGPAADLVAVATAATPPPR